MRIQKSFSSFVLLGSCVMLVCARAHLPHVHHHHQQQLHLLVHFSADCRKQWYTTQYTRIYSLNCAFRPVQLVSQCLFCSLYFLLCKPNVNSWLILGSGHGRQFAMYIHHVKSKATLAHYNINYFFLSNLQVSKKSQYCYTYSYITWLHHSDFSSSILPQDIFWSLLPCLQ